MITSSEIENPRSTLPRIATAGTWGDVFTGERKAGLEAALPVWLAGRRWFGDKARAVREISLLDAPPIGDGPNGSRAALVEIRFHEGPPALYVLPLDFAPGDPSGDDLEVARLVVDGRPGVIYGAERDPGLARNFLELVASERRFVGTRGELVGWRTSAFAAIAGEGSRLEPVPFVAEQSNTSFRLGDRALLKLFRRTAAGPNPDLELGTFLTEIGFSNTAPVLGGVEYRRHDGESYAFAILQGYVPNRGDAWSHALAAAGEFLERVEASGVEHPPLFPAHPLDAAATPIPPEGRTHAGLFLEQAALLGRRTAELHRALASRSDLAAFAPGKMTPDDQRARRNEVAQLVSEGLALLRIHRPALPAPAGALAERVLAQAKELPSRADWLLVRPVLANLIRIHGDYHLGQVLWTGQDFCIIDFEGEPARPLAIRRAKQPALRDVAGMLRSFQYAGSQAVSDRIARLSGAENRRRVLTPWARTWVGWASAVFLRAWIEAAHGAPFFSDHPREQRDLLDLHLLEKAVYELIYEINHRPTWIALPLEGLADLAETERRGGEYD